MTLGTLGIAILAISSDFRVFIAGLTIFSIGEMTAHPKYISYLGLIAPPDKKATYMGFGFLYGVFGSLIGNLLGGFLYVHFINDRVIEFVQSRLGSSIDVVSSSKHSLATVIQTAEQSGITREEILSVTGETTMWLLYAGIGLIGIIGLLLYDKYILKKSNF